MKKICNTSKIPTFFVVASLKWLFNTPKKPAENKILHRLINIDT